MRFQIDSATAGSPRYGRPDRGRRRANPSMVEPEQSHDDPAIVDEFQSGASMDRVRMAALEQALQSAEAAWGITDAARLAIGQMGAWMERMTVLARRSLEETGKVSASEPTGSLVDDWDKAMTQLERLAADTRFGETRLLNGSLGSTGGTVGVGLSYAGATDRTRSSPPEGYAVHVESLPEPAQVTGEVPLTEGMVQAGIRLLVREGNRKAGARGSPRQSPQSLVETLAGHMARRGIPVDVRLLPDGRIRLRHGEMGSGREFAVHSSVPGVLAGSDGRPRRIQNGRDIAGSIHGEPAIGAGSVLTGAPGNVQTEGVAVQYRPPTDLDPQHLAENPEVGRVIVVQRALTLRRVPGHRRPLVLQIESLHPSDLGCGAENTSGFAHLAAAHICTAQAARDALRILRQAHGEVAAARERVDRLRSGPLQAALNRMQNEARELSALRTATDDPALAMALAHRVSRQMGNAAGEALSAQRSPIIGTAMRLMAGDTERSRARVWN